MCGIVGYIGTISRPVNLVIDVLKRLEYRGYDSWGLSSITCDKRLNFVREIGKISELSNDTVIDHMNADAAIVIGHTRWATHGKVTSENAHPQLSNDFKIAIVHNGVIENHEEIRNKLMEIGYDFHSETDTEVIVNLLQNKYVLLKNFKKAVIATVNELKGAYGIAIACCSIPHRLYIAKMSSPLSICDYDGGFLVSSDPNVCDAKEAIILEDGDIAELSYDKVDIFNKNAEVVKRDSILIEPYEEFKNNEYPNYMIKEIFEQPDALRNLMRGRLVDDAVTLDATRDLGWVERIKITACGSSWYAGLIGQYYFEKIASIPTSVEYASEYRYKDPIIEDNTLLIPISQSGETADTIAAIKMAKDKGIGTCAVVNTVGSAISRMCDSGIYLRAGREYGVAATKSFSNQLLALLLLAISFANLKKKPLDESLLSDIKQLPDVVSDTLGQINDKIKDIALKYYQSPNFLYIGRLLEYPIALEGALKLKEISYIHAEGMPAAELKHGPIALITDEMPTVVVATQSSALHKTENNVQEIKARGGKIISITKDDTAIAEISDYNIKIPYLNDILCPLISVIPVQLLAYHIALLRGHDVDKPRNLAKSVTVE